MYTLSQHGVQRRCFIHHVTAVQALDVRSRFDILAPCEAAARDDFRISIQTPQDGGWGLVAISKLQ